MKTTSSVLVLLFTIFAGQASFANRLRMGGHPNPAFTVIWTANAGRFVAIDPIVELESERPGPYRLAIELLPEKPALRVHLFKNDSQIELRTIRPTTGGTFAQKWINYVLEADGLRFEIAINAAGSMPVNVYSSRVTGPALMRGRAQLAGVPAKCGEPGLN